KAAKIENILGDFKGLSTIANAGAAKKKENIAKVVVSSGNVKESKEDVAEIFASFYEALYAGAADQLHLGETPGETAPDFTMPELTAAIRSMKNGNRRDSSGIVAEMLKNSSQSLRERLGDWVATQTNRKLRFAFNTDSCTLGKRNTRLLHW
ncbi:unnamed protein product, partial [Prorocentrum cordatum]